MPQLAVAVGAYAASYAAGAAGYAIVAKALMSVAVSSAVSFVTSALTGKPKAPSAALGDDATGRLQQTRQATAPRRVIYGEAKVSGPMLFMEATGPENTYFSVVVAMAAHEVEAFSSFWLDDVESTFDASGQVTTDRWVYENVGRVWVYPHTGTADQVADAALIAESGGRWTEAHRLAGVAYCHMRMDFKQDVFPNGAPQLRALVKGAKVYDPRSSATAWSDNPALCLRDYLVRYVGVDTADIDDASVIAAANVCDETVALAAGGSEKRYTVNGTFTLDEKPADIIERILSSMAGTLVFVGGEYSIHAGAAGTASLTLTEGDLSGPVDVVPHLSRRDLFNAAKAMYIDPAQDWQAVTSPPRTSATYEVQDGGQRIVRTMELPFTTSYATAQRLCAIELERGRQQIAVTFPAKPLALQCRCWDVVNLTLPRFGWTDKPFRVVGWALREDLGVDLQLREEAAAMWAWSADEVKKDPAPNTSLPNPFTASPPGALTISEALEATASGTPTTVLSIAAGAATDGFAIDYELQVRVAGSAWVGLGVQQDPAWRYPAAVDGAVHDFRVRARNVSGVRSSWSTGSYTPIGQSAPPADVTGFAVNMVGDQAHLSWSAVGDVDLSHYRLKFAPVTTGATWGAAAELVSRIARPATAVTVPAMVGTWLIKAVDLKGNESSSATLVVSTVASIRGLNLVETLTEGTDWSGTHDRTVAIGSSLKLDGTGALSSWSSLAAVPVLALGGGGIESEGIYSFAGSVDLGAVYTSRLTPSVSVTGSSYANLLRFWTALKDVPQIGQVDPADFDVTIDVRTTDDDPADSPNWSVWSTLTVGDYTARAFQMRLRLASNANNVTPVISAASVRVDMPERQLGADDVVAPAAGLAVTFAKAFRAPPTVVVSGQDMATGDYIEMTGKSAAGFTVRFRNAAGSGVARTFDWQAIGYGERA